MEVIPGLRGYALALGSFASKVGKPGVITEWNWRGLTRMSPAARAAIYPPIFENALSTRAVPEMFQFQFNETLAPNPYAGRGNLLRHYELVHLSRRPKLEAFELMKLIRRYSDEHDPVRRWEVPPVTAELDRDGEGAARLSITNHDSVPLRLSLTVETPAGLTATLKGAVEIIAEPGMPVTVPLTLKVARPVPGFYYCFVRMEAAGQPIRYGWIQARLAGRPALDVTTVSPVTYSPGRAPVFDGVGSAPCVVAYESNAPVPVVETAIAIAETLEAATGQEVEALQLDDLSEAQRTVGTQVLVGTPKNDPAIAAAVAGLGSGPLVARVRASGGLDRLVITGGNPEAVAQAGMDFLLRYWKFAKNSAVNRVGMEQKDLPRGLDLAKLP